MFDMRPCLLQATEMSTISVAKDSRKQLHEKQETAPATRVDAQSVAHLTRVGMRKGLEMRE
jgi:hypothetical protein